MPNMITLEVQISILAKLPSLTQRAIRKFERAGVSVVSVERSRNRVTIQGTLKVKAASPHCDSHLVFQHYCAACIDAVLTAKINRS